MKHKKWRTRKTTYREDFVVRGDIYYLGIRLCPGKGEMCVEGITENIFVHLQR